MSDTLEKILLEFVDLSKQVNSYKDIMYDYRKQNEETQSELRKLKELDSKLELMDEILGRLKNLEDIVSNRSTPKPEPVIEREEAETVYWLCSPKQHAVIQMIFAGKTTPEIAARLDVTENGAKSQVRYLCNRLKVNSKSDIIKTYRPIWEETNSETYLMKTKIPKDWCSKYGHLNYSIAKRKDNYFTIICETNYRRPTVV